MYNEFCRERGGGRTVHSCWDMFGRRCVGHWVTVLGSWLFIYDSVTLLHYYSQKRLM